jgi:DnaJ-class molecular chaperone
MPRDYYEVLGVKRDATDDEIKKVYRKLARQHHPDRNPGDKSAATRFKEIQEAYDVLSDKDRRAKYDRFGFAGSGSQGGTGPFQWGGAGPGAGGFQNVDPEEAADVLRQFFGGMGADGAGPGGGTQFEDLFGQRRGRGSRRPRPAPDLESELTVPFNIAALGGTVGLNVDGTNLDVKVPAGVKDGQALRLQGQAPGGGNLLLKIRVAPHPYFRRDGNDLILEVPISLAEAVLGGKVEVPALDGTHLTVKVPPGSSSGGRLRLRGKGINGGDQYIELRVVVPSKVDERSRGLIQEFAERNPQDPRVEAPWR